MYKKQLAYLDGWNLELGAELEGDRIKSGFLQKDGQRIPIANFIPRFVPLDNYASSFGFQWNRFKLSQFDSRTGLTLSKDRLFQNTRWLPAELAGKKVLEVGCGGGRFTEILLQAGAQICSIDYSTAVDTCLKNNGPQERLLIVQGDLYQMPFQPQSFDYVFCYGVLQHTPDPSRSFTTLVQYLKPGGKISIDHYVNRFFSPWCTPKYLWRPITKHLKPETLLKIIRFYIPYYLPFDTLIRRIPKLGPRLLALVPIPCWNYLDFGLNDEQREEWAILDTFDALSPTYDQPSDFAEYRRLCSSLPLHAIEMFYGSTGMVLNAQKT